MFGLNESNTGQSTRVGIASQNVAIGWRAVTNQYPARPTSLALSNSGIVYGPGLVAVQSTSGQTVWRAISGRDSAPALDVLGREYAFENGILRARNASNGQLLWERNPNFTTDGEPIKIGKNGTVFVPVPGWGIGAYDVNGNLKWRDPLYNTIQYGEEAWIPATDVEENLYFATLAGLRSVDSGGNIRWDSPYIAFTASRVMLSPFGTLIWQRDNVVEERDRVTGALLRSFSDSGNLQAIDLDGNFYFTGSSTTKRAYNGQLLWSYKVDSGHLVVDAVGNVFVGGLKDVLALSPSGQKIWQLRVTDGIVGPSFISPIIGDDGHIYVYAKSEEAIIAIIPEPSALGMILLPPALVATQRRRGTGYQTLRTNTTTPVMGRL
ncbi:MAG TPA: hypothetical protein VGP94_13200 [Tepidisphaeraceae bacterium]|jgi:outer membrane protein assembly factor BamB|nr:hypothetical protein [Tepidisphaeraceae bacterium]